MPPAASRRKTAKSKLQALRSSRPESGKTNLNHIGLGTSQIATIRRLVANKQLHFATACATSQYQVCPDLGDLTLSYAWCGIHDRTESPSDTIGIH